MNDEHLKNLTKGNSELMKMLVDVFISQNNEDLSSLEKTLSDENFNQACYFVHKIKSSYLTLGFMTCYNALHGLEVDLSNGRTLNELNFRIKTTIKECLLIIEEVKIYRSQNF